VAFSPDSRHVVSGLDGGTIHVWNATTGEKVAGSLTEPTGIFFSVAFSPDGQRIVSSSSGQTIHVWNATTGENVAGSLTGHQDIVISVTFSPDGQRIVSGSLDGTIRMWNAMTGEIVASPYTGHTDWVTSVIFSPDGQRIVSGSDDGTIYVWNATTGEARISRLAVYWARGLGQACGILTRWSVHRLKPGQWNEPETMHWPSGENATKTCAQKMDLPLTLLSWRSTHELFHRKSLI